MKHVLMVLGGLGHEGITSTALTYLESIDKSKLDMQLCIAGNAESDCLERVKAIGIKYYILPARNGQTFKYSRALFRLIKREKIDVIHVHGNSATVGIDLLTAMLAGCKKRIAHSHNTTCSHIKADKILRPILKLTCNTRFACGEAAGKWLFGSKKFYIIPNAIDTNKFTFSEKKRNQIRNQLHLGDELLLGHVGVFNYQKNQEFLIEVISELAELKNKRNAKLLLIGEGYNKDRIIDFAEQKNIASDVIFYGLSNEVSSLMSAMDMFVLPSRFEGLPCVLIEAQAAGLPCIVSDQVSKEAKLTSLLDFLPIDRTDMWTDAIQKGAFYDREQSSQAACIVLAQRNYDIKISAERILELYQAE